MSKQLLLDRFNYSLYVISDNVNTIIKAIDDGAAIVQLRDKTASIDQLHEKALEILEYKEKKDFILIINDDPGLAKEVGADGVHIGQDFSTELAREIIGPEMLLGKSIQTIEQAELAVKEGADYLAISPVFNTPNKPELQGIGLELVQEVSRKFGVPIVAIGGIDVRNVEKVLEGGAKTICVIRAAKDASVLLSILNDWRNKK